MAKSKRLLRLRRKSRKSRNVRYRGGNNCPMCQYCNVQANFYAAKLGNPKYCMCPNCARRNEFLFK